MTEATGQAADQARLVLVGTPLGNREDLSARGRAALLEADLLFCEDTRSPLRLLGEADAARLPPRVSCFVANEGARVDALLDALREGKVVAYVSEAGMPVWSDPGAVLVRAAVGAGFEIDVVPGPTAASIVLAASGFDATGALFLGFIERSGAERKRALETIARAAGPVLLYEAGNRTPALMRDLATALPDADTRQVVIGRELTKRHQQWIRGSAAALAAEIGEPLRGEVTVAIAGAPELDADDPGRAAARAVLELMLDASLKPKARAKAIAALTGESASAVYDRLRGA